jgi:hypothetical protein
MRFPMNDNFRVYFKNPRNKMVISFRAYLTSFSDPLKANWEAEAVYGRQDPIQSFKNTTRTVSISFTIPAEDVHEAAQNLISIRTLQRMLYPNYRKVNGEWIMSAPPLMGIRIPALLEETGAIDAYVYGAVESIPFEPVFEEGMFTNAFQGKLNEMNNSARQGDYFRRLNEGDYALALRGEDVKAAPSINISGLSHLPKAYKMSITMNVLHKNPPGFRQMSPVKIKAVEFSSEQCLLEESNINTCEPLEENKESGDPGPQEDIETGTTSDSRAIGTYFSNSR